VEVRAVVGDAVARVELGLEDLGREGAGSLEADAPADLEVGLAGHGALLDVAALVGPDALLALDDVVGDGAVVDAAAGEEEQDGGPHRALHAEPRSELR
jgi:hypothetical protein